MKYISCHSFFIIFRFLDILLFQKDKEDEEIEDIEEAEEQERVLDLRKIKQNKRC